MGCSQSYHITNFVGKNKQELEQYANEYHLKLQIEEVDSTEKIGTILNQTPSSGTIQKNEIIKIVVSKGINYEELKINELGDVPIMMYHGIFDQKDEETNYIGGNVDKDGYQRTKESFIRDLEFYYEKGYRMIRLSDFIEGTIDVPIGKSPIILTFDDGKHNIDVSKNALGEIVINPSCAVGILESFKEKYPDYHVTATFFLNGGLFESEYNEEIINWLIDHGYDIGNHSMNHPDFSKITKEEASKEIGQMYSILDSIIPNKYISVVALPFGSPYRLEHDNFSSILNSSYNGVNYQTHATLRVGWEANVSPFSSAFDATFLKRIRAYDNDGKEFDIKMNFDQLEITKFVSDGDPSVITIPDSLKQNVGKTTLKVNTY